MSSLSDTMRILLSTAASRDSGSLLPLPSSLRPGGGAARAVDALIRRGLAAERAGVEDLASRPIAKDWRHGVFITPAGLAAIGVEAGDVSGDDPSQTSISAAAAAPAAPQSKPRASSKTDAVLALLMRSDGATMAELIAATGWLAHTTRALLTGLRKKGHAITRDKRGGITCYHIAASA